MPAGLPLLIACLSRVLGVVPRWDIVRPIKRGIAVVSFFVRGIRIDLFGEEAFIDRLRNYIRALLLLREPVSALGVGRLH